MKTQPTAKQYDTFNEKYELLETVRDLISIYRLNLDEGLNPDDHLSEVESDHVDDMGDDAYSLYTINDKRTGVVIEEINDTADVLEFISKL